MKGVSMPINTIIFLAIGLIVLAALVALFMGSYLTPKHTLEWQAKLNAECNKFVTAGNCEKSGTMPDPGTCTNTQQWCSLSLIHI